MIIMFNFSILADIGCVMVAKNNAYIRLINFNNLILATTENFFGSFKFLCGGRVVQSETHKTTTN